MNIKRKIGILLILIGIGTPLVLFFFQEKGTIFTIASSKTINRRLTPNEIYTLKKISELKEKAREAKENEKKWSFEEFMKYWLEYEKDLLNEIVKIYGENHFENETWNIYTHQTIDISVRHFIGLGILFALFGIGFFLFSFFSKEIKPENK